MSAETQNLVIAGSDTSSTCLAAALFYLVRNPQCLKRLTAEVRNLNSVEDIVATNVQESKMPYLRACVDETLRMAPPVPAHIPREVLPGGAVIDGKIFPAGTVVGVSTYALHHNEAYFNDPFTFSPERWIVDPATGVSSDSVAEAQSAFCPFSIGTRGCIGKNMAYMELGLALTYLLWNYDIRAKAGDKTGEGAPGKAWGRERNDEYQLFDHFVSKRDGPVVEFKAR
jgi:cytochrome P450